MDREAGDFFFWWRVGGGMGWVFAGQNNQQHKGHQKVGGYEIQGTGEKRKGWVQREVDRSSSGQLKGLQ